MCTGCMQTGAVDIDGHGYVPLCPASQQHLDVVQTTAADAPPALLGTPGLAGRHDLMVVRLGELCCFPAPRWVAGREGGAVWRHMVVRFSTLTSYLAWNLRQCNTPLHISQPDGRSHHHLDRASSVRSRREGMCAGDVLLNEGPRDHMLFPFPHNRSKYLQEDCPPP